MIQILERIVLTITQPLRCCIDWPHFTYGLNLTESNSVQCRATTKSVFHIGVHQYCLDPWVLQNPPTFKCPKCDKQKRSKYVKRSACDINEFAGEYNRETKQSSTQVFARGARGRTLTCAVKRVHANTTKSA